MEYYSAIKKNEILSFAIMQMNLKGITLSETIQTEINTILCHLCVESKTQSK